jgi:hypothetical protein
MLVVTAVRVGSGGDDQVHHLSLLYGRFSPALDSYRYVLFLDQHYLLLRPP